MSYLVRKSYNNQSTALESLLTKKEVALLVNSSREINLNFVVFRIFEAHLTEVTVPMYTKNL